MYSNAGGFIHSPGSLKSPISALQIASISSTVIRGVSFPLKVPDAPINNDSLPILALSGTSMMHMKSVSP